MMDPDYFITSSSNAVYYGSTVISKFWLSVTFCIMIVENKLFHVGTLSSNNVIFLPVPYFYRLVNQSYLKKEAMKTFTHS